MSSSGKARQLYAGEAEFTADDLIPSHRASEAASAAILHDYVWGGFPPAVTEIPYGWLDRPARFRPDQPRNVATISRSGGSSARAQNAASVGSVGERPFTATINSQVADDPRTYAEWIVAYYTDVRQRMPTLTLNLIDRTDVECWRILGRGIGDRIRITGAPTGPTGWPDGVTELVIEGIEQRVGVEVRTVVWNTVPVIGATAGTAGPWFRTDASRTDGTDVVPF